MFDQTFVYSAGVCETNLILSWAPVELGKDFVVLDENMQIAR